MKQRLAYGVIAVLALSAPPAFPQRNAVSADLSPEAAAEVFTRTVFDICVPAIAGNGVSSLAAAREGRVQPTQDADTRRQAGAEADETVWDVSAARGVVTIREAVGQCTVMVYGPKPAPTFQFLGKAATNAGFRQVRPANDDTMVLESEIAGNRIVVSAYGASPGAEGHRSQYPVITSTARRVQ